jgi:hypothetical protein
MYNADHKYSLHDFSLGLDVSSSETELDKRSLRDCQNFILTPNKGLAKRSGIAKKYATAAMASTPVLDMFEYPAPNGTTYILVAIDKYIKSYYSSTWNTLKTFGTGGKRCQFAKFQGNCFIVNGLDTNTRLYNTTAYNVGIPIPAAAPTVVEGDAGTLSGKYKYKYCYRRSTPNPLTGNPSAASTEITVTSHKVKVTVVASADPQVDKIWLYRTYNLNLSDTDPLIYEYVTELTNTNQDYQDDLADSGLGALLEEDNGVPPLAKFVTVYKNKVFYANLPNETDGTSKIVYSKVGKGDAIPSDNYEFFDRGDGNPITGIAALAEYFIAFKRNKILVIAGDFETKTQPIPIHGIGCIASWAILVLEDRIVFLAEEGWMSFDGVNLYNLSKRMGLFLQDGSVSINESEHYSAAFYPAREQFQFLCNHITTSLKKIFVGHFLLPLLFIDKGIPEQTSENLVGWTYHTYENQILTCIATYTDSLGLTKLMAGTSTGYIYNMDTGIDDDGYDIPFNIESGWFNMDTPPGVIQTLRLLYFSYGTSILNEFTLRLNTDFLPDNMDLPIYGLNAAFCGSCYCGETYCGIENDIVDTINLNVVGSWFKYQIYGSTKQELNINSLTFHSRIEGVR